MTMTDPIADTLTRIRNAIMAGHSYTVVPSSKMKLSIARILKDEGFIENYDVTGDRPQPVIRVWLKYAGDRKDRRPVITELKRVSKPGRRVYASVKSLPRVNNGLGVAILSTPKGVMADHDARDNNVGGEILCTVF